MGATRKQRLWECAVVIAMAIAAACARKGPAIGAVRPTAADSVFIDVENQGFYDASIFVSFAGSTRRRLGTAQAYSDATFTVRWEPYDLWVEVDFVGVRGVIRTAAFSMNPGETLEVQLPASSSRTGNVIARRR